MGYSDTAIVASLEVEIDGTATLHCETDMCIQTSDWNPYPIAVPATKISILVPLAKSVVILETVNEGTLELDIDLGHVVWVPQGQSQTIAIKNGSAILIQAEASKLPNNNSEFLCVEQEIGVYLTPVSKLIAKAGQDVCNSDAADAAEFGLSFATLIATELSQASDTRTLGDCNNALHLLSRLSLIDSFISKNLGAKITVPDMATLAGLSVHEFIRQFKKIRGISPYRYVVRKRVLAARRLLAEGDDSIADIAYAVGFSSQSHLTVTFREHFGTSPGHYRRATN